jgi:hypothetical protein
VGGPVRFEEGEEDVSMQACNAGDYYYNYGPWWGIWPAVPGNVPSTGLAPRLVMRTIPCASHCYCLDVDDDYRVEPRRPHVRCCKCGDEHLKAAVAP